MATDDTPDNARDAAKKRIDSAAGSLAAIDGAALTAQQKARIERLRQKTEQLSLSVASAHRLLAVPAAVQAPINPIDEPARSLALAAEQLRSIDRTSLGSKDRANLDTLESRTQRLSREVSYAVRRSPAAVPSKTPAVKTPAVKKTAAKKVAAKKVATKKPAAKKPR